MSCCGTGTGFSSLTPDVPNPCELLQVTSEARGCLKMLLTLGTLQLPGVSPCAEATGEAEWWLCG